MYRFIIRPVLFLFSPEKAHSIAAFFLQMLTWPLIQPVYKSLFGYNPKGHFNLMGLTFTSRVGLAAGFDKDAKMYKGLTQLGFGFLELGTITPKAQSGNPKPRLFRLPKDKALINRMGFNNEGVDAMVERLRKRSHNMIIGGNIGKNKLTDNADAIYDYLICFNALFDHVDYFAVNVSSPNTPGLRELQDKGPLKKILNGLQEININRDKPKPILLKIAPDLSEHQLDEVIEIAKETGIEGLIATNTTIERNLKHSCVQKVEKIGAGGLSGKALTKKSLNVVRYLRSKAGSDMTIIGVGGIFNAEDAENMIEAGADLVQIFTGFIYEGPGLIKSIGNRLSSN